MDGIEVEEISFDQIVEYWKEVDHFNDPNKNYRQLVSQLGPFRSSIDNPISKCYGLYDRHPEVDFDGIIGVTQLYEWDISTIRFRTINIRKEWRHQGLGALLLEEAYEKHWSNYLKMFGWMKISKLDWALQNGFQTISGTEQDNHIGVIKEM
jgi:GNAT superfamily N-acetyltransferase